MAILAERHYRLNGTPGKEPGIEPLKILPHPTLVGREMTDLFTNARVSDEKRMQLDPLYDWLAREILAGAPASLDEAINPPPLPEPLSYTFEEVREQIIHVLGVETFKANGFSTRNLSCIFHDDKHPSATLHREKGLYCFVCGKTFTWKELAGQLGIQLTVNATENVAALDGFIGMSRAERRMFISAGFTNLARVLDVLIDRERTGEWFTLRELTTTLDDVLSSRCIRDAFDNLRGYKLPHKRGGEFQTDFSLSYSFQHKESKISVRNSKRGRLEGKPPETARIPTPAEITEAAKVSPDVHYGMTAEVISNAANYRAACMADEIRRKPGKYARKQLTTPLGISAPTIRAYCDRAGIVRTPQPPKLEELTPSQVIELPANRHELRLMIAQKKIKPNICLQDERGIKHIYTRQGASRAAEMGGGKLYRVEYQASDYRPK